MTQLLLIRHGQTEWNKVERFRGQADLKLNQIGLRQAEALAQRFASLPLAAIYSSPLKRAIQTAQAIAQRQGLKVQPDNGLIDIDFGEWQGLSLEEAAAKDSALCHLWVNSPHLVKFPRGESLEEVRQRAVPTLKRIISQHPEQTVALVSHKVVCKVLICSVIGGDNSHFWQVEQDVAAVNVFLQNGNRLITMSLNDTCHLRHLK